MGCRNNNSWDSAVCGEAADMCLRNKSKEAVIKVKSRKQRTQQGVCNEHVTVMPGYSLLERTLLWAKTVEWKYVHFTIEPEPLVGVKLKGWMGRELSGETHSPKPEPCTVRGLLLVSFPLASFWKPKR